MPQARSPGGQLGLEALAQLSEEMLARCTLLAGLGAWLADVGHEAGAAEGVSLAGERRAAPVDMSTAEE